MTIQVVVCDDQALVRAGFVKLLEAADGLAVAGEAADGLEAVAVVRRTLPDVALMDIRMPRLDGISATRRIVQACGEGVRVLVLTTFGDDAYVFDALHAGASGFLLKDAPPESLVAAIHVIARGESLLDPAVTRSVVSEFVRRTPSRPELQPRLAGLTAREQEILRLLAAGLSNAEIAAHLVVSSATVKAHIGHLLAKLEVRDRVQAVILAYEAGLVPR
jgi:DNA-binding NarL/FixJ family response regulator